MIPVMSKKKLDKLWEELGFLESLVKRTAKDNARIKEIQHMLELNARRIIWNNRGIQIIEGGKIKVA